jgi:hypothetical protein
MKTLLLWTTTTTVYPDGGLFELLAVRSKSGMPDSFCVQIPTSNRSYAMISRQYRYAWSESNEQARQLALHSTSRGSGN